jgi:nucleoside 2-deoxyribosyltransferase
MSIHVVGGLYHEFCVRPQWDRVFGSAGRAALAIGLMGGTPVLHCYANKAAREAFLMEAMGAELELVDQPADEVVSFRYLHDSAPPVIRNVPAKPHPSLVVRQDKVVRFGMLESDAVVHSNWAVYDPQNAGAAVLFGANGSTATHLALVLNSYETRIMAGLPASSSLMVCARAVIEHEKAEVVVVKMGPAGAMVVTRESVHTVPAFRTDSVWKIGSGDTFVAHFAWAWMDNGRSPTEAAAWASRATAYYCLNRLLPSAPLLEAFDPTPVEVEQGFLDGRKPLVYLAGPFFDIGQVWLIEEARARISELGLNVFSPFHDIGLGAAADVVHLDIKAIRDSDILFAIADGIDAGTHYEIGYARALNKPVVVLCEREPEEAMKMASGSGCLVVRDFTSALYTLLWEAVRK